MAATKRASLLGRHEPGVRIVDRIRERIAMIQEMVFVKDFEAAHQEQMQLYEDLLKVMTERSDQEFLVAAAKEALKTSKIVTRWE